MARRGELAWSEYAEALPARRRSVWAFLQRQWLVSPETTGWVGGVQCAHAPSSSLIASLIRPETTGWVGGVHAPMRHHPR